MIPRDLPGKRLFKKMAEVGSPQWEMGSRFSLGRRGIFTFYLQIILWTRVAPFWRHAMKDSLRGITINKDKKD